MSFFRYRNIGWTNKDDWRWKKLRLSTQQPRLSRTYWDIMPFIPAFYKFFFLHRYIVSTGCCWCRIFDLPECAIMANPGSASLHKIHLGENTPSSCSSPLSPEPIPPEDDGHKPALYSVTQSFPYIDLAELWLAAVAVWIGWICVAAATDWVSALHLLIAIKM